MPQFLIGFFTFCSLATMLATPALAYVGPGSGLGAIAVAFGIAGTLLLSLVSFIWYPVKRLYRRLRRGRRSADG